MTDGPMTDGVFGTWTCGNKSCPNHTLTGMEVQRRWKSNQAVIPSEPTEIKCGRCGVVTQAPQVGR